MYIDLELTLLNVKKVNAVLCMHVQLCYISKFKMAKNILRLWIHICPDSVFVGQTYVTGGF